jgi:hypothetical protein
MRRINTLKDLRQEKRRLLIRRNELETEIKVGYAEIKASFEPMNMISKGTEKVLGNKGNHLLGNSAGQVANYIAKFALKRSGLITRLLVPFLIKNTTSNIVENHKTEILNWVGGLVSRFTRRKPRLARER